MTAAADKQTHEFQTEVRQLLKLMIHSLYSNREIFLRELISNASDAADKLRFQSLQDEALLEGDGDLAIRISFDKEARTLTVADNGIGMSRDEVQDNLGTIARSGTRQFLEQLSGDQSKDARLIGQFGVGFYSAFIVADRVTVLTRKAGEEAAAGVRWESTGEGEYTIESEARERRGTEVILHLKEDADEFLDGYRLRRIIRTYSDHIDLPIRMAREAADEEGDTEDETVNKANALWMRPRNEIKDEEYVEFYKHVAHDFDEPLTWMHNKVEGNQSYASLLYIPKRAPFDLWDREGGHGVKLYVKRIFIMDDAEQLMPRYLRFVRGVIDSDDLPLNVSREILQNNRQIDRMRAASVKRILDTLEKMAADEAEKYAEFWGTFGRVLKEGPAEDFGNRERVAKLLRFASTRGEGDVEAVSLDDYIGRMKEGQEAIYYVTADSFAAARNSPHLEVFRKYDVEVLLLGDPVDEWWVSHLQEYDGKRLVSAAKGELDPAKLGGENAPDKAEQEKTETELKPLVDRLKAALGETVESVRVSSRLTDSPACLVVGEQEFAINMQRMLKAAGQPFPTGKPTLEINPDHAIIRSLGEAPTDSVDDWAHVLYEQALLVEGGQLEDPAAHVKRVNRLLQMSRS
ncbi:molecular chaperone HtpG [Natronocella acetinitrilica]|uniref:Chaperone protein HtpG n=1 Tax=Natronocella acetinitrilica TaxID=414046 RepID=A0AAE3G6U1_9GAMM|nr:molecular chaperone HtpG [Natronocella acetinitrilica]MCP1676891.1 molecular chaperone HtpG [Natronocella acetinitrilica]